jgi:hypothetical protein
MMLPKRTMKELSPRRQLASFIAKFSPDVAADARAALGRLRARLPGSIQIVYDNYNALAIGFGPTERASDAVFSIALYPRWVSLFFLDGVGLPDPKKLLKGGGTKVRHIVLSDRSIIDSAPVQALIFSALVRASHPFAGKAKGRIVIKSISKKQRPRRNRS